MNKNIIYVLTKTLWLRHLSKITLAIISCLVILLSNLVITHNLYPVNAQNDLPFYWNFINVDIDVQKNGDMLVKETQKYTFNKDYSDQRSRYIPLGKVDDITDISVTENGKSLRSISRKENNNLIIKWKHRLNPPESHTFVISYRVVGGLHIETKPNLDQVYWKAIFRDRKVPIKNAKITVKLPQELAGNIIDARSFGVPTQSSLIDNRTLEFISLGKILPQQEIEVQVSFPHDILNLPRPYWQSNIKRLIDNMKRFLLENFVYVLILIGLSSLFCGGGSSSGPGRSSGYGGDCGGYGDGGGGGDCGGGDGGGGGGGGGD